MSRAATSQKITPDRFLFDHPTPLVRPPDKPRYKHRPNNPNSKHLRLAEKRAVHPPPRQKRERPGQQKRLKPDRPHGLAVGLDLAASRVQNTVNHPPDQIKRKQMDR